MRKQSLVASACAFASLSFALPALAQSEPEKPYTLTGHVDVVSKYILRGASTTYGNVTPGLGNEGADAPESDRAAFQWGADFVHNSGFYAGYWASTINYSYKALGNSYDAYVNGTPFPSSYQKDRSVENDFYAGYTGSFAGDFTYTAGLTGYVYYNGEHANAFETKFGLAWKTLSFNAQTLLNDTVWGNRGDTYWTLNYSHALPWNLNLTASLGAYTYTKEGKYLGTTDAATGGACAPGTAFVVNGCYAGNAPVGSGFRHLIVGVTQGIGSTGVTWGVQGLIGGDNRYGIHQENRVVFSLAYGF
ncbi:TorF family putative porin [Uliginosibacterium sp. H1]|uniref:TorF family putative porin n=1 Tax=Uliginosibacterium sp. H1 TaxID=3114757 RepID=UPI002E181096|nr:TorF family putative porin [Uliginosibacterium sp. H1]MEC5400314.1 TorF family putative porin [Uliginosibacterium sp. H1]